MGWCSTTKVVLALAFAFIVYEGIIVYSVFYPSQCSRKDRCIAPLYPLNKPLELWVFSSKYGNRQSSAKGMQQLLHWTNLNRTETRELVVDVRLADSVLNNGTLYAHVYLGPKGRSPTLGSDSAYMSVRVAVLTQHKALALTHYNLLSGSENKKVNVARVVSHWIPWLSMHSLQEDFVFDYKTMPWDLAQQISVAPHSRKALYLPLLFVDRLRVREKELLPLGPENNTVSLKVKYSPLPIGQLRFFNLFEIAKERMSKLGFTEREFEDVKGIFLDTNFWLFGVTILVAVLHLVFDFLAFKNDIDFWVHRKTTVGIARSTVVWQCFSQSVVFFFLLEEKSSLIVTIPAAIAALIEYWKVSRAFKLSIVWNGRLPSIQVGSRIESEVETAAHDMQAVKNLSYLLFPLVLAGTVYQLVYKPHTSWYNWGINSLANGVYAFGFLFMLPQLFLNYKLKSVAHLPWRAFMYKACNTFIDDVCAFIIVMPTAHRIAVFRDDLVFLIYLYQRWLYPVDKSRVNEYGETFDKEHQD